MLMSAEANGGDVLVPPDAPGSERPGEGLAELRSLHARARAHWGFASTHAVHSVIAELIHPYNTIK